MESSKITSCCNCNLNFTVIAFQFPLQGRLPYVLHCGHSICDKCLHISIGSSKPIKCNECQVISECPLWDLSQGRDQIEVLKRKFPLNYTIIGQLTVHCLSIRNAPANQFQNISQPPPLYAPAGMSLNNIVHPRPQFRQPFKRNNMDLRTGQDIENFIKSLNYCKEHEGKSLDVYCKLCNISLCVLCTVKLCRNHELTPINELKIEFNDKILKEMSSVRNVKKRMINTIKDLEKKRFSNMSDISDKKSVELAIMNLFSQAHGQLQYAESELLEENRKCKSRSDSFLADLKDSVEKLMNLLAAADRVVHGNAKMNHPAVYAALKAALDTPWYLDEDVTSLEQRVELEVDQEMLKNIKNLGKLKKGDFNLKLLATSELPSYMELPPLPPDDTFDTASQKSGSSSHSSFTINGIEINDLDFEFRPKNSTRSGTKVELTEDPQVNLVRPMQVLKIEERPLKPLVAGMEEKVTVTHINNPHDFYIQRNQCQSKLRQLSESYSKVKETLVIPEPDAITPGSTFLIYDNRLKWCRVIVLAPPAAAEPKEGSSASEETYFVKFIDYGHSVDVPMKRLRIMPVDENSPPPYAVLCSLADCHPAKEQWTNKDQKLMETIISSCNNVCTMTVIDVKDGFVFVELVTYPTRGEATSTSVRDALVFLDHARLTSGKALEINRHAKGAELRLNMGYFRKQRLPEVEQVVITHVEGPDKFFVRFSCLVKYYDTMAQTLSSSYSLDNKHGTIFSPFVDMCVACYIGDKWYRGRIKQLKPNSSVLVFLVDVGSEHVVAWDNLRKLIPKFFKSDELVTECKLAHVRPAVNNVWSQEAKAIIEECKEEKIVCSVKLVHGKKKKGNFFEKVLLSMPDENGDPICINSLLVEKGLAQSTTTFSNPATTTTNTVVNPQPSCSNAPATASLPNPQPSCSKTTVKPPAKSSVAVTTPPAAKEGDIVKLEVSVLSAVSPSEIYVGLKSEERDEELKKMHEELQRCYKTSKPDRSCQWKNGDKCVAVSKKKTMWARAIVNSVIDENKQAKVFFKDFGLAEQLPIEDLRPLAHRFLNVADGAIKCHLNGISPASGDKWPMLTRETLQELVDSYDKFYITKDGEIDNNSLPVQVWVIHVTPGGALTPTIKEFKTINDMIVEKGLAIPTRVLKKPESEAAPQVEKVEKCEKVEECEKVEVGPSTSSNEDVMNPPNVVEHWLPALPLKHTKFDAVVTFVEDNLDIFLYDVLENTATLDLLSQCLTDYFKDSKPKPYDLFWFNNQICVTKYELDNKYYRAVVLEILENNMALVRFIDYGNTQKCPISSLRKDIVMENIPIQVYRCKLDGIKPVSGDSWDQKIGDLVHRTIVEKTCSVTVTGDPDEMGVIPIRLKVNMAYDLADLLLSLKYAVPAEVPKPTNKTAVPNEPAEKEPDIIVEEEIQLFKPFVNVDWNELNKQGDDPEVLDP